MLSLQLLVENAIKHNVVHKDKPLLIEITSAGETDEEQYDYVFDAVDKTGFLQCKRLLKKKGIYTSSGGFGYLLWSLITKVSGGKKVLFIAPKDIKGNLSFIKRLIEEERFRPVIDRTYPLDQIAEAFTYAGSGQKIGNVIITMNG